MATGQWVVTTGSTALVAATAKTAIELTTSSTGANDWYQLDMSFNGITSTAIPVTCEIITYGTTGTGTAITFAAAHRASKATQAAALNPPATTAKVNLSVEGTTSITVVSGWFVHPQAGVTYQFPLGREFGMNKSLIYGIRFTAPAVVNYITSLYFEE
jgi:hypothetical protein